MSSIIEVKTLVKKYGELTAVDGISFSVEEGNLFAFLGPNGAGKSTTINILCTLLEKTAGAATLAGFTLGKDDSKIRHKIGVVFQDNVLDDLLTVKENLLTHGGLYGKTNIELEKRLQTVSQIMGIDEFIGRRYGKLSGGQKRRAEIARALMSNPSILILDEPTTGLDPQTRLHVWEIITKLQKEYNMTVFLTTHYMEEAANADMVAIIDGGKIVASGTPNELKAKYSTDVLKIAPTDSIKLESDLISKGYEVTVIADMLQITIHDSLEALSLLKEFEGQFTAFEVVRGNMDNVFVNITGHKMRGDEQ